MKNENKGTLILAGGGALFLILNRLFIDTVQLPWHTTFYGVILTITVVCYLGLRDFHIKNNEAFTYAMEWRAAMRPAALAGLFYSVFTFIFYKLIDPGFFTVRIDARKRKLEDAVAGGELSPEKGQQVLDNFNNMSEFITPLNFATFTLLSILIYSMFMGALITVVTRSFPKLLGK